MVMEILLQLLFLPEVHRGPRVLMIAAALTVHRHRFLLWENRLSLPLRATRGQADLKSVSVLIAVRK